ncbi:MAG: hypothetical protein WAX12_06065 [Candidatus Microthrix subdominans]
MTHDERGATVRRTVLVAIATIARNLKTGSTLRPLMLTYAANFVLALLLGMATGLFFERRSTSEARAHTEELKEELKNIKLYINTFIPFPEVSEPSFDSPLSERLLERARSFQNPQGQVSKASLMVYFFSQGFKTDDIEKSISQVCEAGQLRESGKWLEFP